SRARWRQSRAILCVAWSTPPHLDVGRLREHRPCQGPIAAKCPSALTASVAAIARRTPHRERTTGSSGKPTARKELPGPGKKLPRPPPPPLLGERAERRRLSLAPAVGYDAERFDEALPAAGERDRHAEIDDLIVRKVGAELGVERRIDRRMLTGEP